MNKTLDTQICDVTVYPDKALVTRRGVVQLMGEEHELIIAQLPVTLVSESVRVRSASEQGVQLSGVRTERISTTEVVEQKIAQLTQEIAQIEEQKRQGQDVLALLNLQSNFVKTLSNQYLERLTKFSDTESMSLTSIREFMDFVGQQYGDFSSAIAQKEKDQKQQDSKLQSLRQQLQQLSNSQPQESYSIIITLEPNSTCEFEIEVSYMVHKVTWIPLYDVRFNPTNETLNISCLAQVKQNTGEDWLGVNLTLSTAKPELSAQPPKLAPWYIDVQPNPPGFRTPSLSESVNLPSRAVAATMPFAGTTPSPEIMMNAGYDYGFTQTATPDVSKPGTSVTHKVSSTSYIPSDGLPHKTTIFSDDYSCHAEYIVLPRIASLAYLQTKITNPLTGVTLLPGKVNIFIDNTFVGTTQLETIVPGQEFKINLGVDEGIKIQRNLVERQVDQNPMSNLRRTTYAYQIMMTNLRECDVKLKLTEQLPMSRHEQVKVRLTLAHPDVETSEMGLIVWSLTLPSLSKQELYYQFTVDHPSELTVVGLDI
ncbi:MAG TPA: mucoidy inhibitor MuiA family protein [Waterburya sp.]|jgi:uncharacterized protein (TIGR02231 family)